ncbi:MAG: family 43 glycosylhydrolase [Hyphomicrobiales bacterium]
MTKLYYADPIQDGAADPTVIRNVETNEWWMFYTNRRAHHPSKGASWINGSPIGIATSVDGIKWRYKGTVQGLDRPEDVGLNTHWAPEVIYAKGEYHMYLTYFIGAPDNFDKSDRDLTHFTSPDLESWTRQSILPLQKPNVMDACVALCPDGLYRMWYKDEAHSSCTWSATSEDLYEWQIEELVIPGSPSHPPHEGPNVFTLGGYHWLITDEWKGLAVFRSDDMRNWTKQGYILDKPGQDLMDKSFARHADIVVNGTKAVLFYFTHPEWNESEKKVPETGKERRTTIHNALIWVENGLLLADRDAKNIELF